LEKIPGATQRFDVGAPSPLNKYYALLHAAFLKGRKRKMAAAARYRTIAFGFLKGANPNKYYGLCADLENQYARGTNQYSEDITSAYNLLLNHKSTVQPKAHVPAPTATPVPPVTDDDADATSDIDVPAVTFLQHHGTPVTGTDRETHPGVTCFKCDKKGHYSPECPKTETGVANTGDTIVVPTTNDVLPPTTLCNCYKYTMPNTKILVPAILLLSNLILL